MYKNTNQNENTKISVLPTLTLPSTVFTGEECGGTTIMWTRGDFSDLDSRIILDSYQCVKYISLNYPKSEYMNIISVMSKTLDLVFLVKSLLSSQWKLTILTLRIFQTFSTTYITKSQWGILGGTHPVPPPPPKIDKIKFNHKLLLAKKMYNFFGNSNDFFTV